VPGIRLCGGWSGAEPVTGRGNPSTRRERRTEQFGRIRLREAGRPARGGGPIAATIGILWKRAGPGRFPPSRGPPFSFMARRGRNRARRMGRSPWLCGWSKDCPCQALRKPRRRTNVHGVNTSSRMAAGDVLPLQRSVAHSADSGASPFPLVKVSHNPLRREPMGSGLVGPRVAAAPSPAGLGCPFASARVPTGGPRSLPQV
jgi:hypothetical protein